jgi:hypothetical protein
MPRGDRTGPRGMGSMTGRGAGYCAGYGVPGYMNPGYGRAGMGYGAGGAGRGWRNRYWATGLTGWQRAAGWAAPGFFGPAPYGAAFAQGYGPTPTRNDELEMLRNQVGAMEQGLEQARERLAELEQEGETASPGESS